MHLGSVISRLESEAEAGDALAALGDIVLYAEVSATAARFEESPAVYTAGAVARFASGGSDEDWVGLIGALERTPEPGRVFLVRALRWAMARDALTGRDAGPGPACTHCWKSEPCDDPNG